MPLILLMANNFFILNYLKISLCFVSVRPSILACGHDYLSMSSVSVVSDHVVNHESNESPINDEKCNKCY